MKGKYYINGNLLETEDNPDLYPGEHYDCCKKCFDETGRYFPLSINIDLVLYQNVWLCKKHLAEIRNLFKESIIKRLTQYIKSWGWIKWILKKLF